MFEWRGQKYTATEAQELFSALKFYFSVGGQDIAREEKRRTDKQNNSLNLWVRQSAEALNAAGMDMRKTLREDWEIPWTEESFKEHIWRPIQKAMFGYESTTEASTSDYNEIYQTICRELGGRKGVARPPWPDRFGGE